ncbi:hypothetical protein SO694_0005020 [Aureococcus anophagefferens]|uniref:Uncharacterized protein n=1 Tax=Aureococcus anophagefferens TaxID=44056 RepID=A0ABR1FYS0_AURAN
MIARPKISRNEWKTTEIGAFEVGNFALFSRPDSNVREPGSKSRVCCISCMCVRRSSRGPQKDVMPRKRRSMR